MEFKLLKSAIVLGLSLFVCATNGFGQNDSEAKHKEVTMRMIGHQILLSNGDSLSRIMPIKTDTDGRYLISFENDFKFVSEELVSTVSAVMTEKNTADHYLVEVESCDSGEVVYSYEVGNTDTLTVVPCQSRIQLTGCYVVCISIFDSLTDENELFAMEQNGPESGASIQKGNTQLTLVILVCGLLILAGLAYLFVKRKRKSGGNPDIITIGRYEFDQRNMTLSLDNHKTELTSKECDLLALLFSSANETLEHEEILKAVWGSNGDYVGRTLDVFISKLRKKLDADATIKIINIRGVGYKLILNS